MKDKEAYYKLYGWLTNTVPFYKNKSPYIAYWIDFVNLLNPATDYDSEKYVLLDGSSIKKDIKLWNCNEK